MRTRIELCLANQKNKQKTIKINNTLSVQCSVFTHIVEVPAPAPASASSDARTHGESGCNANTRHICLYVDADASLQFFVNLFRFEINNSRRVVFVVVRRVVVDVHTHTHTFSAAVSQNAL